MYIYIYTYIERERERDVLIFRSFQFKFSKVKKNTNIYQEKGQDCRQFTKTEHITHFIRITNQG